MYIYMYIYIYIYVNIYIYICIDVIRHLNERTHTHIMGGVQLHDCHCHRC